jgi:sulfide:quinone oxidoreductase
MTSSDHSPACAHVVVAGGGFAGLEAVLAVRAIAGTAAQISLVSPDHVSTYRPAATLEAFSDPPRPAYDLVAIAADLGLRHHRTRVQGVAPAIKRIRLGSGAQLTYDALVRATGTRPTAEFAGALTFRDQRDPPGLRAVLRELDEGKLGSLVFAVPSGCSWPLPLYKLALLAASRASAASGQKSRWSPRNSGRWPPWGPKPRSSSQFSWPNAAYGSVGPPPPAASAAAGRSPCRHTRRVKADRVVAAPQLRGAKITGIPPNRWGFVPTDAIGPIQGMVDVYAAET